MLVGIDLGTTYSACAYLDENGVPHIVHNSEGKNLTPSVVLLDDNGNVTVGEAAKDSIVVRQEDVISVVKNEMGKKIVIKEKNEIKFTPEMVSSLILKKIIKDAEDKTGKSVEGVVITVPAYFDDAKRKATEDAAAIADIELVGIINEPTAAALWYAKKNSIENETVLVYDLGGGTFDVTVLKINKDDDIVVMSTGGLSATGGRFFDQYIVDYICDYIDEKHGINIEDDEYIDELQELYLKAENAKIILSSNMSCNINIRIGNIKESIEITREIFETKIKKLYERTERKVKETIKASGLQIADIDKVILIGGSSRIPYIEENLTKCLGKIPSKEINPDEAVAKGAAIYAGICASNLEKKQFTDVCSHGIGVVVVNEFGMEENEIIIPRNSTIPTRKTESFRTMADNQEKIHMTVTEGEYKELTDVSVVGSFDIDLPTGLKKNTLIHVSICLNDRQLLEIHVTLPEIGLEKEYKIKRIANMDEAGVENATGIMRNIHVK